MILIDELTETDKGRRVRYRPPKTSTRIPEDAGVITSWNKNFIFVRYDGADPAAPGTATHPEHLSFERRPLYQVDLKIYQPVPGYEIPHYLPRSCYSGDHLRQGYHSVDMFEKEEEMESFCRWVNDHQDILKVIGLTPIDYNSVASTT